MWKNLTLLLFSSLLSLVMLLLGFEVYRYHALQKAEAWHDPLTAFDPMLGWSPIPSAHRPDWGGLTTNSVGYRSAEIDPGRKPVLLVGDSVAWGYGVADDDTPSAELDRLLAPSGLQVHNLAVSGYDVGQYVLRLEREIVRFVEPAWVVVVLYPGNDLRDSASNTAYGKRKPLYVLGERGDLQLTNAPIARYCLQNLFAMSSILSAVESPDEPEGRALELLHDVSTPLRPFLLRLAGNVRLEEDVVSAVTQKLIVRIAALAALKHAKILFVSSPPAREYESRTRDYRWFQEMLAKLPHPYLDYFEYVNEHHVPTGSMYRDRSHYSESGSKEFARAIAERIGAE